MTDDRDRRPPPDADTDAADADVPDASAVDGAEATDGADTTDGPPPLFAEHVDEFADRLAAAEGLLFCTDFDGTLAPITQDPDAPEPTANNRERLIELADHPRVRVAAVSGRALEDLRGRLGIEGIDYAGNHGLEIAREGRADEGERTVVHPIAAKRRRTLTEICDAIEERVASIEGCVVENKAFSGTVHYRRSPPEATDRVEGIVREVVEGIAPGRFERSPGKDIVEIDPAIAWDKGRAVELLAEDCGPNWLTVYAGDDTTDETAFRTLAADGSGFGIHVGDDPETAAHYRVADPEGVEELLAWLLDDGIAALERSEPR